MRGPQDAQARLFFTIDVQSRILADHPLRDIKLRVDRILAAMTGSFDQAYSGMVRPSVPPERLLKALLLQALYSVRSETRFAARLSWSSGLTRTCCFGGSWTWIPKIGCSTRRRSLITVRDWKNTA